jgi:hypothetical protein
MSREFFNQAIRRQRLAIYKAYLDAASAQIAALVTAK